jgi:hypothetical protein
MDDGVRLELQMHDELREGIVWVLRNANTSRRRASSSLAEYGHPSASILFSATMIWKGAFRHARADLEWGPDSRNSNFGSTFSKIYGVRYAVQCAQAESSINV